MGDGPRHLSVVLAFALLASACGAPRAEDPQSVLRAYATALEQGRSDDAYRLLSDDARRGSPSRRSGAS